MRNLHAVEVALAAAVQKPLRAATNRICTPTQRNDLPFAGNEKQVPTGCAQLAIQVKAVELQHRAPSVGVTAAAKMGRIRQEKSLSDHHGAGLDPR